MALGWAALGWSSGKWVGAVPLKRCPAPGSMFLVPSLHRLGDPDLVGVAGALVAKGDKGHVDFLLGHRRWHQKGRRGGQ